MTITKTQKSDKALSLFSGQSDDAMARADHDFVEGLLDLLCSVKPMTREERRAAGAAVRAHYGAGRYYVAAKGPDEDARELARKVLSNFNGRNAREVARKLGIGKTTVYRVIKQSGRQRIA